MLWLDLFLVCVFKCSQDVNHAGYDIPALRYAFLCALHLFPRHPAHFELGSGTIAISWFWIGDISVRRGQFLPVAILADLEVSFYTITCVVIPNRPSSMATLTS